MEIFYYSDLKYVLGRPNLDLFEAHYFSTLLGHNYVSHPEEEFAQINLQLMWPGLKD